MCTLIEKLPEALEDTIYKMSHEMQYSEVLNEFKTMDFSTKCKRGCTQNTDARCCCDPGLHLKKNTMKQFNVCPQKLYTLFYIMVNESFMYQELFEREGWRDIDYIRAMLKLSFADGF